jgi:hypothetical protein
MAVVDTEMGDVVVAVGDHEEDEGVDLEGVEMARKYH